MPAQAGIHFSVGTMDSRLRGHDRRSGHRLFQISDDVRRILDADGQPHHIIAGAGLGAVLVRELADVWSEAGWMIRLRVSPILARWLNSVTLLTILMPAS